MFKSKEKCTIWLKTVLFKTTKPQYSSFIVHQNSIETPALLIHNTWRILYFLGNPISVTHNYILQMLCSCWAKQVIVRKQSHVTPPLKRHTSRLSIRLTLTRFLLKLHSTRMMQRVNLCIQ